MENAEIKICSVNDLITVKALAYSIWPEAYKGIITSEQIEYMLASRYSISVLQEEMAEGDTYYLLLYHQRPVGFASYGKIEAEKCKLHKLYLLPECKGKSFGRFLMIYITSAVKQQGFSFMQLQVNRSNPAVGFYLKMGFNIIKTDDFAIGGGFYMNDYVMEKKLE